MGKEKIKMKRIILVSIFLQMLRMKTSGLSGALNQTINVNGLVLIGINQRVNTLVRKSIE
jgi:hypothetical protein